MVLGYDTPRPTRESYDKFMERLEKGLRDTGCDRDGLSLMLYGSYVRGDYVPGRSDIDATIIFPHNVVIDKPFFRRVGNVIACALDGSNVPFQVTPADIRTMEDGTFNSYSPDFQPYFEAEGKVVVGPDYRNNFRYKFQSLPEQGPLTFNLRKARQGLLLAPHFVSTNYHVFLEKFNKSLDAASRASKQVLHMLDGEVRGYRFAALPQLQQVFPGLDVEPLVRMKKLYSEEGLPQLNALYRDKTGVMAMWESSVTFFESLIKAYLDKA